MKTLQLTRGLMSNTNNPEVMSSVSLMVPLALLISVALRTKGHIILVNENCICICTVSNVNITTSVTQAFY